jgi:hypothetical protein
MPLRLQKKATRVVRAVVEEVNVARGVGTRTDKRGNAKTSLWDHGKVSAVRSFGLDGCFFTSLRLTLLGIHSVWWMRREKRGFAGFEGGRNGRVVCFGGGVFVDGCERGGQEGKTNVECGATRKGNRLTLFWSNITHIAGEISGVERG